MKVYFEKLSKDDTGAVTVDWIVLTGLAVGLTLSVMAVIGNGTENGSSNLVSPATITTEF